MDAKNETIQYEKEYPDPRTLPAQPSWQQPRPQLTLSDLIPGEYVSATARVVHLKTSERKDALGSKMVFSGVLEDSTFKIPFVSHRVTYPLLRNSVYKFYSAYVNEFEDKSLLLVVTEHTKIEPKNIEDYREFVWAPKIESIKRPVHYIPLEVVANNIKTRIQLAIVAANNHYGFGPGTANIFRNMLGLSCAKWEEAGIEEEQYGLNQSQDLKQRSLSDFMS